MTRRSTRAAGPLVGLMAVVALSACDKDSGITTPEEAGVVLLVQPAEGGTVTNICDPGSWTFVWTPVVGAARYHLQVLDPSGENVVDEASLTTTSFAHRNERAVWDDARSGWTWRVRAQVGDAWGEWSPAGSFQVALLRPVLLSPPEGATLDNGCPDQSDIQRWDFEWGACAGATRYHLFIKGPTARYPVVDFDGFTDTRYTSAGHSYVLDRYRLGWRWRVRAQIDGRWTEWTGRSFDVEPLGTDCE